MRKNEDELVKMSDENSPMFEDIEGLVSRYTFSNLEDGITSGCARVSCCAGGVFLLWFI